VRTSTFAIEGVEKEGKGGVAATKAIAVGL